MWFFFFSLPHDSVGSDVMRTRTKGYELQENFPDARFESSHRDRIDRSRQVLDEHSILSRSPFTHRRPFIFLLFVLGGKGQGSPPTPNSGHVALCPVDTQEVLI